MEYEKLEGRRQFEEADDCILKVITVNEAYLRKLPYAAQTYAGVSDRVISMPWLRLPNRGTLYTGAMGLPRELSVVRLDGEKYLAQSLPREWRENWVPVDGDGRPSDGGTPDRPGMQTSDPYQRRS